MLQMLQMLQMPQMWQNQLMSAQMRPTLQTLQQMSQQPTMLQHLLSQGSLFQITQIQMLLAESFLETMINFQQTLPSISPALKKGLSLLLTTVRLAMLQRIYIMLPLKLVQIVAVSSSSNSIVPVTNAKRSTMIIWLSWTPPTWPMQECQLLSGIIKRLKSKPPTLQSKLAQPLLPTTMAKLASHATHLLNISTWRPDSVNPAMGRGSIMKLKKIASKCSLELWQCLEVS